MPIYSFYCPNCNHKFEVFKSRSQAGENQECPECSSIADRDWYADNIYTHEQPRTLGYYADKNADKMSDDQKEKILSRNRRKPTKNPYIPKDE